MKKYIIKLNDKVYEVEIEEVTGEEVVTTAEIAEKSKPQATSQISGGETIEAPMPGNIVDVKVKAGDLIKKGQVLVILEAMKMENEIVSPVDGRIALVGVSKGQAVNPGEVLVKIV
jgi:biotin carboxyl carrier protein